MDLDVEMFGRQNPAMDAQALVPHARAAHGEHGTSPRELALGLDDEPSVRARALFATPNPQTSNTFQRPTIVEYGAVVMAGLILNATKGLQFVRASLRGSRVDYFAGVTTAKEESIVEVSGTDDESLNALLRRKRVQLLESPYRHSPWRMRGYVIVSRFADRASSLLETVEAVPEAS